VDEWYSGYAATVPAMAGSLLTFLYHGAALWAAASLLMRRYPLAIPRRAMPFVISCLGYFAVLALAGIGAPNREQLPAALLSSLAFLFVPLLIARYRFSAPERALRAIVGYAPLGAAGGLVVAAVQLFALGEEASGGAGNPNVYGAAMALLAALSLGGLFGGSVKARLFGLAGFAMGSAGVFLAAARTLYPVILLLPIVLVIVRPRRSAARLPGVAAVLVALTGIFAAPAILSGLSGASRDLELVAADRYATSIGFRVALWTAALDAIKERPLLGHGPQNKMDSVVARLPEELSYVGFTHAHNGLLDTAVAAGLVGGAAFLALLAAPLAMLVGTTEEPPLRRYIVLAVLLLFAALNVTGTPFAHDLTLVLFLLPLIICAAADPRPETVVWRRGSDGGAAASTGLEPAP
jgi:O-antigen ligase